MLNSTSLRTALLTCLVVIVLAIMQHQKSFTADEVYELRHLSTNWALVVERPDGFPPLYSWMLSHFSNWTSPTNGRMLSAIFAVIGLNFVAATGYRLGANVGWRASLFYAFSACQLEYAQQARAYSLYICLGAVVLWASVGLMYRQRISDWITLILSSVAVLWSHYYAAIFLVAVWMGTLILGWLRTQSSLTDRNRFLISYGLSATGTIVLLIPWLSPLRIDLQHPPPIEAINTIDWTGLAYTMLTLLHGWCVGPSQMELFEWSKNQAVLAIAPWAILSGVLFAMVVWCACFGTQGASARSDSASGSRQCDWIDKAVSLWLVATMIAVPLVSALFAVLIGSSFVPRYMAVLIVPLSLLFGLGSQFVRLNLHSVASGGLIVLNLISFVGRNYSERYDRENYRELETQLMAADPHPKLLVLSHYLGNAIEYQTDSAVELIMVGLNSDEPDDWREIQTRVLKEWEDKQFWIAADWMRGDDLRLGRRDKILAALNAMHVKRIAGTLDLFKVSISRSPASQKTDVPR